ncbi:MAG: hypothetical protein RIG63_26180 [Coleofasciculus chthonoplastes F3-SA18-01]|uniref:hypothetical protein n=1 Tax=Coleofasciculus chthonoplastes TaxID=64178 RepID=UPI0032F21C9C
MSTSIIFYLACWQNRYQAHTSPVSQAFCLGVTHHPPDVPGYVSTLNTIRLQKNRF